MEMLETSKEAGETTALDIFFTDLTPGGGAVSIFGPDPFDFLAQSISHFRKEEEKT